MPDVISSLAPALACGFAVQQALDLLDGVISLGIYDRYKKPILKTVALAFGVFVAATSSIRVLAPLSINSAWVDLFTTALIIGGGTEAANSVMKLLAYKKEEMKGQAARSESAAGEINIRRMGRK